MSVLVDAVRTASRSRRYVRLRRAQSGTVGSELRRALLLWALPAVAPALAVLASAMGRTSWLVEVGVALLALVLLAHLIGKPRLTAFDLLHQPTRRGLVLGHLLHRLPLLLWAGLMAGASWMILMPWLPRFVGGALALGAVVLAPMALGVSAGAARVAGRAGRDETGSLMAFLLPFVGWETARGFDLREPAPWLLPVVGGVLAVLLIVRTKSGAATVRKTGALVLTTIVVAVPSSPEVPLFATDEPEWIAAGVVAALSCLTVLVMGLQRQLSHIDRAEIVETRPDAEEVDARAAAPPAGPLRRERSGRGLWHARLRYLRDEWLPHPDLSLGDAVQAWGGLVFVGLLTVLRGPILAAAAVALAGADRTAVWLAVLAGCLAHRVAAVDTFDLEERLWLLGVDYRDQVLQGLRSLVVFAAVPTLLVALGTLTIAGPGDTGRHAAVMVVAGTLILRAGLPGLWPLQETNRLRLIGVWAVLLVLAVAFEAWWTPLEAMHGAAALGGAGLVLLAVRLVRLREPRVADCVRRAGEP